MGALFMWYYLKQRLPLMIGLGILLLMGLIFGSIAVHTLSVGQHSDLSNYLKNFFASFPQEYANANRLSLFKQTSLDNIFKSSGLMWILSLSIIGAPLVLAMVFLRGFVLGFTVGIIFNEIGIAGIPVAAASVLPHNLVAIPAIIITATVTLSFAISAVKTLFASAQDNILQQFLATTIIVLICCGLLVVAAGIETIITPLFIKLARNLITP